jgi:two-component system CheB/CheR fusion protein
VSDDAPAHPLSDGKNGTDDGADDGLERLLQHMRSTRGLDLTGYKTSSLTRRIRKRMDAVHSTTIDEYRRHLDDDQDEFTELFNTILINVTSFFRDPEMWSHLAEAVIPQLTSELGSERPLRVWVAGCATGEEAFTIAMLLCEALGDDAVRRRVKIYATDVDQDAVAEARHGRYARRTVTEGVPAALIDQYFEPDGGYLVFRKDLRRTVIFGRHDLVQDPPISRIDLLSCRNTLMYFNPPAQARILANLHYALRPRGFLVLGRSEALATRTNQFSTVDLRYRIFRRASTRRERDMSDDARPLHPVQPLAEPPPADVRGLGFELGASAQILVDVGGAVVAANHQARNLFGLSPRDVGRQVQDLELSYRPLELRSRLDAVYAERRPVTARGIEWHRGADTTLFDVMLHPIVNSAGVLEGTSVAFVDVSRQHQLQDELQRSKSELESAYEELQSAVEELETTNEELQSTNEELETTNERGAAVHQRGAGDHQRGAAVDQRGARDHQRRAQAAYDRAQRDQQLLRGDPHQPALGRGGGRS